MEHSAARRSLAEFQETFPDESRCATYLFKQRWRDEFECPGCSGRRAAFLESRAFTYECRDCRRQTSITAGTVMHRSKLPLTVWFSTAYFLVTHPHGISTRQLQERLGITYQTAWLLKKKLELSNSDQIREMLDGLVEVNHSEISCRQLIGRPQRITVAVACEVFEDWAAPWNPSPDLRPNLVRLEVVPDTSPASIQDFIQQNVEPEATLLTDGAKSYLGLTDYRYFPREFGKSPQRTLLILEAIKNWLGSQQKLSHDFVEEGLVQIAAHLNWRSSLDTVLRLDHPSSYWDIIGRDNPRRGIPTTRRRPRRRKTATGMREDGSG
jgi:hypothetical protein